MSVIGSPPFMLRAAELGRGLAVYPGLEAAQWLAPERLQSLQWQRLRRTLEQAAARSPYYRRQFAQLGIQPSDIRSLDDFRRLPSTSREELRAPDSLIADNFTRDRLRGSMTSGSTGQRTTSYFDERAWVLAKYLLKLRARRACGLQPWHRVALFQEDGSASTQVPTYRRYHAFSIHRPIADILPAVQRFAADAYYGFPGYFVRLAEAAQGSLRPRMIFTSGELLDRSTSRAIEDGFNAPVFDVYGCTEVKEVAWQCPVHAGHHLNADWVLFEIDPPGAAGKILLTPLYNRAMPLLRYEVGDTGILLSGRCSCGRGLPLIRPTLGRSADYLQLPNGTTLAPYSLTCAVEAIEGMRQYQFVQIEPARIELRIVPRPDFGDGSRAELRRVLAPVLPGVAVHIELVAAIPSEPSGKYRIVKSLTGNAGPAT
jgi:phenylacetate-CoA ligase